MRGTRLIEAHQKIEQRNTPAYAGNTKKETRRWLLRWEHPRVCGEHWFYCGFQNEIKGTPPRMRGTRIKGSGWSYSQGNTPAYAGNTQLSSNTARCLQEHPRVCGEHGIMVEEGTTNLGTPPRMRGTHHNYEPGGRLLGNTPAYAGNTIKLSSLVIR